MICRYLVVILLCWLVASPALPASDWNHWRGPQRNDIVTETSGWNGSRWLAREGGWQRGVGEGCTSPLVIGSRLYTLGWKENRDTLWCLDATNGDVLWQQSYPNPRYGRHAEGDQSIYSGISSTPEYDPQTGWLYTLSTDGALYCWDTKQQGRRVWSLNLYDRYRAPRRPEVAKRRKTRRDYGYTSSPLVIDDLLVVEVGAPTGNTVALDKRSGRQRWASRNTDEAGHTAGPVPITVEGVQCVVVLTLRNLVVIRTDKDREGQTVATVPWTTDFANNIPTPAVSGSSVIVTSAYNQMAISRLDISLSSAEPVWKQPLASGVCSPIIHRGYVYWAWQGVYCLDFATGKPQWQGGTVGRQASCIVTADDRLIIWGNQGDLLLAETARRSPDRFRELARLDGLARADAWPHVVLAHRRLYVKDRYGMLICLPVPD